MHGSLARNAQMNKPHAPKTPEAAPVQDGGSDDPKQLRDRDDPDREATELHAVSRPTSSATAPSAEVEAETIREEATASLTGTSTSSRRNDSALHRFWRRQVYVAVPHEKCRDHLGQYRSFGAAVD